MLEQFVEVKVLIGQEVNAGCLAEEPWVRSIPTARPGPDIDVEGLVGEVVCGRVVVEGTQTKLDKEKLPGKLMLGKWKIAFPPSHLALSCSLSYLSEGMSK